MLEDWQFCFIVKGLVAPVKEIKLDNLLIRGFPPSEDACVFFEETVESKVEKSDIKDKLKIELRNILQLYGLVTNNYVDILPSSSHGKIEQGKPFGSKELYRYTGMFIPVYGEAERKNSVINIKKTVSKYKIVNNIFTKESKTYLRNAIDYYYRSLKDNRCEEKIIDLMISLESLFSTKNERSELRLRYSHRVAFLLSVLQQEKKPKIFDTVYTLYKKRSKVVHGTEKVKITSQEISLLQKYVQEAIKLLIHIEMSKKDFLKLLDKSVYDKKEEIILNEVVTEAMAKW